MSVLLTRVHVYKDALSIKYWAPAHMQKHAHTHTHTHKHTHTRTNTHTHKHTRTHRHNPASQAVVPNLHVHFTEMTGAAPGFPPHRGVCRALQQAHACPHHAASTWTAPHRIWLQPRIRPLSSRPLRLSLQHSEG